MFSFEIFLVFSVTMLELAFRLTLGISLAMGLTR